MRFAVVLLLLMPGVGAVLNDARAELRQYSESRVEYLVGGSSKVDADKPSPSPVSPKPATVTSHVQTVQRNQANLKTTDLMTRDDAGRREILQQELGKARAAVVDLNGNAPLFPGAGTLAEQRVRKLADVTSLEAELGRLNR